MAGPGPSKKSASGAFHAKAFRKILSMLERNGYVGCLQVSRGDTTKYAYFTVGGVRLHVSGSRKRIPLGKLLVRYGKIKPSQLNDAVAIQERTGRRMGEVLTKFMKVVTPEDMLEMVRNQVEAELVDLITWEGGVYRFDESMEEGLFEGKIRATTISMDIEALAERLLERIDRWEGIRQRVPEMRGVYKLTKAGREDLAQGRFGGFWAEFASLLDGERSLLGVAEVGNFGLYETCDITADLLEKEWIVKVVSGPDEFDEVRDVFEEIDMLERALEAAGEDEVLRFRLAHAYESAGQRERAAANYRILGELKLENYRVDEAVEVLEKAVKLNANDFDAHELLFEIFRRHRPDRATGHGLRLAEIYKTNRLLNRTKNVLLLVAELEPKNLKAQRMLAEVYTTLDETGAAVERYETVAALLKESRKDEARLREIYETILLLDEHHRQARKELKRLYFRGVREVGRVLRIVVVAAVFLAAAAAVLYEQWGRMEFRSLRTQVRDAVGKGDLERARERIRAYREIFFLTSLAPRVDGLLRALDQRESHRRDRALFLRLPRYDEDLLSGDVARIRKARDELEAALGSPDLGAAVRAPVQRRAGRLADFLHLYRDFGDALDRGAHRKAHALLQGLLRLSRTLAPDRDYALEFPLRVSPPGASVFVEGEPWKSDFLRLPLDRTVRLRVEMAGYATVRRELDAFDAEWPLAVALEKKVEWKTYLGGPVTLAPAARRGRLLAFSGSHRLSVLVAASGHARRSLHLEAAQGLLAPPLWREDRIFCAHADGSFSVLDAERLTVLARGQAEGPLVSRPASVRSPKTGLLVLRSDGTLLVWDERAAVFTHVARLGVDVEPGAACAGDVVVAGGADSRLYAYDLKLGRTRWVAPLGSALAGPPVVQKGVVYAATRSGDLWALSFLTGEALQGWPFRLDASFPSGPEVTPRRVYIGSPDKHLYAVNAGSGRLEWKLYVGGAVSSAPTLLDETLYVGTEDGRLLAVDASERAVRWAFPTGGAVRTKPRALGKTVVFGSEDGFLYALWE